MIARTAAILALGAVIAACSGRPATPPRADPPAPQAVAIESGGGTPATFEPSAPHEPEPADPPFEAAYIASAPDLRPPAGIAGEPRLLLGMSRDEVAVWLGPPNLRREEPRSEVWQYAARGCVLHVFLNEAGSPPERRVSHYEISAAATVEPTPEPGPEPGPGSCFETLLRRDEAARR